MKSIHSFVKKFEVAFGIAAGLVILAMIGSLIVLAPEEAGVLITIIGLICASVSMLVISLDFHKPKNRLSTRKFHQDLA